LKEENRRLIERYPFLRPCDVRTGDFLDGYNYETTVLDEIPRGWRIAFSDEMLKELSAILEKGHCMDSYRVLYVKEKFGVLRWYHTGASAEVESELLGWLQKYKRKSALTCVSCGAAATHIGIDYILPYCKKCKKGKCKQMIL